MKKIISSGNARLWFYIGFLVAMAGLWRAGESINARLSALPIKEAPKAAKPTAIIDQKSFYAVWVKQATEVTIAPDDSQAVDAVFNKSEEPKIEAPKPIMPIEPDYVDMFKQSADVYGVSDDGVFVNGSFYGVGSKLEPLSMTTVSGKAITPVLISIKNGQAVFQVGTNKVHFNTGNQ